MDLIDHASVVFNGERIYLWSESERIASDGLHGRPARLEDGTIVIVKPVPQPGQ